MKKFLIASTALTLSAGVAAADVTFSGDARFGVNYNNAPDVADTNWTGRVGGNDSKTQLEKRYTLNIDASTTADNGVTFGVRQRIRGEEGGTAGPRTSALNGTRLFARYQGFEVAVGNVLGAIETMPNMYSRGVSLTGLSWGGVVAKADRGALNVMDWDAYSSGGAGAEGIEVLYSAGDFKGHISYSDDSLNNNGYGAPGFTSAAARRPDGENGRASRLAAYGAYNYNGWTMALGFNKSTGSVRIGSTWANATAVATDGRVVDRASLEDAIVASVDGKIQDFNVGFAAARLGKGEFKMNKFVLNGSYSFGATTVGAYVANQSKLPDVATNNAGGALHSRGTSKTSYGLGASYNLGGGASLVGGVERTTQKTTRADFGVSFRF
ncbi:porin [Falsigemmobacter intermedius]|uniref:Porin n=1 Tax=Falsigemmobacter intermedius TaxID=1553448 RepID=A0A444MAQ3_9RHOB|nr:porin [Falsigemmobacter intermedius]RWY40518.1 porin [Falsigemmobacter intermedius]